MKLQPINGRILVKPLEAKDKTSGGIYLPDTAKENVRSEKLLQWQKMQPMKLRLATVSSIKN